MSGDVLFMNYMWPPASLYNDPDNANAMMNFLATTGQPIPEPATMMLLGMGLLGAGLARRRG